MTLELKKAVQRNPLVSMNGGCRTESQRTRPW